MAKRNIYLEMKPLAAARAAFLDHFDWDQMLDGETLAVGDAVGRVLAAPVYAALSAPSYHGAAMDGIAVRAENTYRASEATPVDLVLRPSHGDSMIAPEIRPPARREEGVGSFPTTDEQRSQGAKNQARTAQHGAVGALPLGSQAIHVNTGEVMPPGTDAVIMIEQVQTLGDDTVRIEAPAFPWQHVRKVGEDIVATEMLFPRHHRITPYCTGALLAGGVFTVEVTRRPRVMIIPTGGEMLSPVAGAEVRPGTIIESNSTVLAGLVASHGGDPVRHDRLADDVDRIGAAIAAAARDFDLVLVIGGSSAGARDFTRSAILRAGGEILVHGITVMPGKPTLCAALGTTPVVGIPGYPVSAIVAFEELVAPALDRMLGVSSLARPTALATPARKIASKLGMEELVRVRLGKVDETLIATPLPRGAGTVTSITQADGILRIAPDREGVHPDQPVAVELLRPLEEVERNLVVVGSHDICLDVIADLLRERHTGVTLASTHVGSLAGLMAVKNRRCHLAGSHLLDPADGSYNTSYLAKHLPDTPVRLVNLVVRDQGLMVLPGNPKSISGFADLVREDVSFVNRQGGSGTRVLLDFELAKLGLSSDRIAGYRTEEYTHMAVAVAVLSGAADVGLGVLSAARALGLDFLPVTAERYDLVIPERFFASPAMAAVLDTIRSPRFAARVAALGGYHTEQTGQLLG